MKKLIFILLILIQNTLFAEYHTHFSPLAKRYTTFDGMPDNEVFHVIQDTKGYIWFATKSGVCKYDGHSFRVFDVKSGLPKNMISELFEDEEERIWGITYNGKLFYIHNDSVYPYKYNHLLELCSPKKILPNKGSIKIVGKKVHIALKNKGILSVGEDGRNNLFSTNSGILLVKKKEKYFITAVDKGSKIVFNKKEYLINNINDTECLKGHPFAIENKNGNIFFTIHNKLFLLKVAEGRIEKVTDFPESILWFSKDRENYWVSISGMGITRMKNPLDKKSYSTLFKGYSITSVCRDYESGYWFSTLYSGCFYVADLEIERLTSKKNILVAKQLINMSENNIAFSSNNGEIWIFDTNKKVLTKTGTRKHIKRITYNKQKKVFLLSGEDGVFQWKTGIKSKEKILLKEPSRVSIYTSYGTLLVGSNTEVKECEGVNKIKTFATTDKVTDILERASGEILISTYNGLWKLEKDSLLPIGKKSFFRGKHITKIYENNSGKTILIGTNGEGVFILSKNNEIQNVTEGKGLRSNTINDIIEYKGRIWVATSKGLNALQFKGRWTVDSAINVHPDLQKYEIKDFDIINDEMFLATENGVVRFSLRLSWLNVIAPKIQITKIHLPENTTKKNKTNNTDWFQISNNIVNIKFTSLTFKNSLNKRYQYRLKGLDKNWIETESESVQFVNLPPNKYIFEVRAVGEQGLKSSKYARYHFVIKPPFWKKNWFLVSISIIFASFIWLVYFLRVKEIKRNNTLQNKLDNYKLQALRQQMNPHFIFNTLNSIQYFILEEDSLSSHNYLTKFAKLMRMTLDNSEGPFIPIEEELKALELYLELENLRFDHRFGYEIKVKSEINEFDYKIPTLIMQPFVENAIWHGLMSKKGKGKVIIELEESDGLISCKVSDNGIGRKRAMEIQKSKKKHTSYGTKITAERLDLLQSIYGQKLKINYTDLYNEKSEAIGTIVEIIMPYIV